MSLIPSWKAILLFMTIVACLGKLIDFILLDRHKTKTQDLTLRWWNKLDDTRVPDLPRLMAEQTLGIVHTLLGTPTWSGRGVLKIFFISCLLTLTALEIGFQIGPLFGGFPPLTSIWLIGISPDFIFKAVFGNLIFDTLTVAITIHILNKIKTAGFAMSISLILLDLVCALFLSIACVLVVAYWSGPEGAELRFLWGPRMMHHTFVTIVSEPFHYTNIHYNLEFINFAYFFFSITTLIPTSLYLAILSLLVLGKSGLFSLRSCGLYLLEKSTENKDKTIFFLTGSLFAFLALISKTVLWIFAE